MFLRKRTPEFIEPTQELFKRLTNEPLLQHGSLIAAEKIKNPRAIPTKMLEYWLKFANKLCNKQGCLCLAFTQLSQETLNNLGFSDILPPRVLYMRDIMHEPGFIIINPEISFNTEIKYAPSLETCGSIEFGNLGFFVARPMQKTVSGWIYDGEDGNKIKRHEYFSGNFDDMFVHEIDHLNGFTVLDHPELFLDLQRDVWTAMRDISRSKNLPNSVLATDKRQIRRENPQGFLGYDPKAQKFIIVDIDGKKISNYK